MDDDPKIISFEANRDSADFDQYVRCCRCNKRIFMHDHRCEHCGLNFDGEAWQFSPSTKIHDRKSVGVASILIAVIVAIAIVGLLVVGSL